MSAYGALAAWYDALTRDVDYAAFADFYEQCFQQGRGACHTLLDFCCGTGTLTNPFISPRFNCYYRFIHSYCFVNFIINPFTIQSIHSRYYYYCITPSYLLC